MLRFIGLRSCWLRSIKAQIQIVTGDLLLRSSYPFPLLPYASSDAFQLPGISLGINHPVNGTLYVVAPLDEIALLC